LTLRGGKRSKCFSCGQTLKWYDLVPILSFLILKARCRFCKSKISWQYPIVEFINGTLWVMAFLYVSPFLVLNWLEFLSLAIILTTLWFIFVYDLKHKIIHDFALVILVIFTLLLKIIENQFVFDANFFLNFLYAFLTSFFIFILWFISKGKWIGFGDVKLLLPLGFLIGPLWWSALILAFWSGAFFSIFLIIFYKVLGFFIPVPVNSPLHFKGEVPFAPFIILGFLVVFFFQINVLSWFSFIHYFS